MSRYNFLLFSFLIINFYSLACTTAVVSGKVTPDGRPLLYKNRDTYTLHSRLIFSDKGKYSFIGMVNPEDLENKSVLNGHNSAGFAIMNSDSYNINYPALKEEERQDGEIIRLALETCASLEDFEKLLSNLSKPWRLSSNFGVIDAQGGAAYYETGNNGFTKFDANNMQTAPFGYIIRTNYSFSGKKEDGKGYSRYLRAQDLIYNAALKNNLTPKFFLQDVSRNLIHGLTKVDLMNYNGEFAAFRDFIPRYYTASAVVFQGVKSNEPPLLTTAWTILGTTLGSITVPLWINNKKMFPKVLTADKEFKTPLNEWTEIVKNKLFPVKMGEGSDYISVKALHKYYPEIISNEKLIFNKSAVYLERWRNKKIINEIELQDFYNWIDSYITSYYSGITEI